MMREAIWPEDPTTSTSVPPALARTRSGERACLAGALQAPVLLRLLWDSLAGAALICARPAAGAMRAGVAPGASAAVDALSIVPRLACCNRCLRSMGGWTQGGSRNLLG